MDAASEIIANLQKKLVELDQKVLNYKQDLATEFNKYTEEVLRGVSEEVSKAVLSALQQIKGISEGNGSSGPVFELSAGTSPIKEGTFKRKAEHTNTNAWEPRVHDARQLLGA